MLSKLRYDNFSQKYFFRKLIEAYLEDEQIVRNFINKVHSENYKKYSNLRRIKQDIERKQIVNDFALTDEDIENIFDAIEKENPDI